MKSVLHLVLTMACWIGLQATATAALEVGSKPTQAAAPRTQESAPKTDAAAETREGRVTALNLAAGQVQIQGQWHDWVAGKSKAFAQGKPAGVEVLKPGQIVRFSASVNASGRSTLSAVHVP
jgi:hypothetical protein